MSARAVPPDPSMETGSEREVWQRLVDQLGPQDVVLANLRLTDRAKDHECDLVVLMPGHGIVVVEVKGGSVSVAPDGTWQQWTGHGSRRIHPVTQARDSRYALRRYVETDPALEELLLRPGPVGTHRGHALHRPVRRLRDPHLPAVDDPRAR